MSFFQKFLRYSFRLSLDLFFAIMASGTEGQAPSLVAWAQRHRDCAERQPEKNHPKILFFEQVLPPNVTFLEEIMHFSPSPPSNTLYTEKTVGGI